MAQSFGQDDEVVSKAPASTSSWGQEDEVVSKQTSPVAPTKDESTTARIKAGGEAFVRTLPATGGFWAGSAAGAAAVAPYAATVAPANPIVAGAIEVAGGLAGGLATAYGVEWATDKLSAIIDPEGYAKWKQTQKQYPTETTVGQFAGGLAGSSYKTAAQQAGKWWTSQAAQRGISAGAMGGLDAVTQYVQTGEVKPGQVLASTAAGAVLPGANVLGQAASKVGKTIVGAARPKPKTADPVTPDTKEVPPDPRSVGERDAFIKSLKEHQEANSPVVQTAIRNKETGEIELMGPKHDEARKAETTDTHEQGFVDSNGNFLDRKQAANRAFKTGQLPKEHKLEQIDEGLHSGDLRKAGDERFELAKVPDTVEGLSVERTTGMTRADGTKVGARTTRDADGNPTGILVDLEHLYNQFKDKPWTKPKVKGVHPIAEDAFSTPQEWVDFVIQHEAEHVKFPKEEGMTKAHYENLTNQRALKTLADKRKAISDESGLSKDPDIKEFERLASTTAKAEKQSDPATWTPEQRAAYNKGDWKEFSRLRGYTEKEIQDYEQYLALANKLIDKYGVDAVAAHEHNIKETPVDRTETSPRDVKDEKEFQEIAQEIYNKHGEQAATKFYDGYREYQKSWNEPVRETEKFIGINIRNKMADERLIHNLAKEFTDAVPNAAEREAITSAVERNDLKSLSPEARKVAEKFQKEMERIGNEAVKSGVVSGLIENYVSHIVNWEGAPPGLKEELINSLLGTGGGKDVTMRKMSPDSKFAKERKFATIEELENYLAQLNERIAASGKTDFRLQLKTKDIAEIYREYATSMQNAVENKKLIDNLKQIRNVAGETLIREVSKDNPLPYGWEMMESPQFAGYAVHPDLKPALKFVFDAGPGKLMEAFGNLSQAVKRMNVIGSFFHAKSLMEVLSSTGIPIWTPIKEVALGGVDKAFGTQFSGITKAVNQFKEGGLGSSTDKWIRDNGLILEMPEDVTKGILSTIGKATDAIISKYGPKTGVFESSLSAVEKYTLGVFDKFTWDFLHTGGKLYTAEKYLEQARLNAAKEGKPFDENAQRKEIATFLNDSFGGLNWHQIAFDTQNKFMKQMAQATFSPEGRRGLQTLLFAPDWTLSTLRAFTAALPKELNPLKWHPVEGAKGMHTPQTREDYARMYQLKTALTMLTLINGINMMTANRPIWENKDPTRIEFKDGTSMQAMKHGMEPYHWMMDPVKTFANKLGFVPKAAVVGITGVEYAGPTAQKLADPSLAGRAEAIAGMAMPFQVQAAAAAPEGEGFTRAMAGTLGVPIYGQTAEQRKKSKAEREKILKQKAKEYHKKAKERGWE